MHLSFKLGKKEHARTIGMNFYALEQSDDTSVRAKLPWDYRV